MGKISKKLKANFKTWASQFRQEMGKPKKSVPIPKDVHDVKSLVDAGIRSAPCGLHRRAEHHVGLCRVRVRSARIEGVLQDRGGCRGRVHAFWPAHEPIDPQLLHHLGLFRFPLWQRSRNHRYLPALTSVIKWDCTLAWSGPSASSKSPAWAFTSIAGQLASKIQS